MADDPRSLAQAAARLEALAAELAKAKANLENAAVEIAQLYGKLRAATASRKEAERATGELRVHLDGLAAAHAQELQQAARATAKAVAERDALAAKWDALYGPVEDGIALGPQPYVTVHDGQGHATLEEARVHLVAQYAGMTHGDARTLIERAHELVPLLQRVAPKP